ncbi:MAG: DUF4386 domain-containing protein [Acholeplasmataceae bacterium]
MTLKKRNLIAGILYLALIVPGPFAYIMIPNLLESQSNIINYVSSHMSLIYVWILLDLLIIGIEIVLSWYLLKIFEGFNKRLSIVAFIFRLAVVAVMFINVAFLFNIVLSDGVESLQMIKNHKTFIMIWQINFSVHVALLGFMIFKGLKNYVKFLGIILMIGTLGYLIDSLNYFFIDSQFFTSLGSFLLIFITLGEISMGIALLAKKIIKA